MTTENKQACIFGGSGFIGRQVVRLLAKEGYTIKVACRTPEKAYFLKTCGNVGQVVPFYCDMGDDRAVATAVAGCDVVINCVGILYERRRGDFVKTHTDFPRRIAKACRDAGIARFIHVSSLGCDGSQSKYGQTKYAGERAVFENLPTATILRPSVVFGAEDNFFNMFARLSVVAPCLPLIGGGKTKFQPVYVGDVAQAVLVCVKASQAQGQVYELGGPDVLTLRCLYEKMFEYTKRPKMLISMPWGAAKVQGFFMGLLPAPLLTVDQVNSLKTDNVVALGAQGFKDLGMVPTGLDAILPSYLSRFAPGGRFGDKKRA